VTRRAALVLAGAGLAAALLSGCGKAPELPPAQPLGVSLRQLAGVPGLAPGPHAVARGATVEWAAGGRRLRARALVPDGAGPVPLVLFSHGFASGPDQYDAVAAHWASHGYAVVLPQHADGGGMPRGIWASLRHGSLGLVARRVADLRLLLDHPELLDALAPGLAARVDRDRIAAAGHSFGAFTAQQFGGAVAADPDSGERVAARDPRVRAVVALSPPGEMFEVINRRSWLEFDAPMLATTGTWDVDGRFHTDWRQHRLSWETALPGRNWLLVVEGADHYLGNLICRLDRDRPPQPDALRLVNAVTTAFLDAHLRGDAAAREFLDSGALAQLSGGFAALSKR
jgi:predicted dienelactone hydrolase